jgi:hypothetical protein
MTDHFQNLFDQILIAFARKQDEFMAKQKAPNARRAIVEE